MLLRALSKCLLNPDRLGALTTSLGSLFQHLTTLSVKKCSLMSSLNLPWHSFEPFPHILSLGTKRRAQHLPLHVPSRMLQRAVRSPLSLLCSKTDRNSVLICSSQDMPSSPCTRFFALLWKHSKT